MALAILRRNYKCLKLKANKIAVNALFSPDSMPQTKRKDKKRRKLKKKNTYLHDRMDKGALKKVHVFTRHIFSNVKQVATYCFEKPSINCF